MHQNHPTHRNRRTHLNREVEMETVLQDLTRIMDQVLMENIRRQQQVSRTVETQ